MSIRFNLHALSATALAVGPAWALAVPLAHAASSPSVTIDSRGAPVIDREALAAEIRNTVQQAIGDAAHYVHQLPQMLAQIDFDDAMLDAPALAHIAGELGGGREIVKNAPYTAEAVTESVQTFG